MKRALILLSALFLLNNCSEKVFVNVTKPAVYDVSDVKRLAILDFNGPPKVGESVASQFTNRLWKAQYFKIMERRELQKILDEHALQMSGIINDSTAVEFGKILGVDALIIGDILSYEVEDKRGTEKVKEKVWKGDYEKDEKGNFIYEKTLFGKAKKKKYEEVFVDKQYIQRSGNVSISFRLVSVETGEIRAGDTKSRTYSQKFFPEKSGQLPSPQSILTQLTEGVIEQFIPLITPYTVRVSKTFEEDNDAVDLGIEYAQKNLWDRAMKIWQDELGRDPQNTAAMYNLGLAYEVMGDFDQAEALYNKALDIEPNDLYMEALANLRQRRIEQQNLEKQLH
jgi:curli biogenesis system outer membrane secretion channel CsgG